MNKHIIDADAGNERTPSEHTEAVKLRRATTELSLPELAEELRAVSALGWDYTLSASVCGMLHKALTAAPTEQANMDTAEVHLLLHKVADELCIKMKIHTEIGSGDLNRAPIYCRLPAPAAPIDRDTALEEAAKLVESFCAADDSDTQESINTILCQRATRVRGLKASATPRAVPLPADQGEVCPACGGSGESTVMSDASPDAHEVSCNCPHCGGSGALDDAYRGVVALLGAERKKANDIEATLYFSNLAADLAAPIPLPAGPSEPAAQFDSTLLADLYEFTRYAACSDRKNTREFLDGLFEHIEALQPRCRAALASIAVKDAP